MSLSARLAPLALALLPLGLPTGAAAYDQRLDCWDTDGLPAPVIAQCLKAASNIDASRAAYQAQNYAVARAEALAARDLVPDWHVPVIDLSWIEAAEGNVEAAVLLAEEGLALAPGNPWALEQALMTRRDAGRGDECGPAAALLAVVAPPTDSHMFGTVALCMQDIAAWPEAKVAYEHALVVGEDVYWANLRLAEVNAQLDDWPAVEAAARAALEASPSELEPVRHLGHALVRQDRNDEALALYRQQEAAIRSAEDDWGVPNAISWDLYLDGDLTNALMIMERWAEDQTDPVDAYQGYDTLAHVYAATGRPDEALRYFTLALDDWPEGMEPFYRERLAALGITAGPDRAGLLAGLGDCARRGAACRLYDGR
ncbi:tetratricopeptide repeat protein [Wenxinia marina]|uniref:Tetratricopeptide repeat protein n=1 Tax=Wenxinia marina DSM 24838 TaxID=1123501 RepID=A0A0D0P7P1_9RHOB|nr:tetratricopeptide repeat protein [Wenxinia marina]KIQ67601.1 hypothetical protein Wenmar_04027 [Wenxinia marina DSM 24838]GGL68159.1 hypothetical protein GCM10011392_23300 [Wenxinia marina]